ncbi:hypothetical protein SETIT_3G326300v2 [Setaria italica]|uniref:Uncharacterized protein n=1 Tax=Setaria italica TaxID=4555 RepID=K3ZAS8_SETIT|nr:hypothetical protein SETIT_3G326300v2 [Setaria italica]
MPGSKLPLAVLLLAAIALLLSPFSCPAAAAMSDDYGGVVRVVTIHGRGTRVAAAATGAAPISKWQRRRLEEAVAPEFGSLLAADQRYINYDTLNKNRQACGGGCAAQGASYTRPCFYYDKCRG